MKRALPITYRQSALPGDSGRLPWGLVLAGIVCLFIVVSWAVRAAEAASSAYVTNAGSASVSVINTATKTVLTNISVGLTPEQIAITPNGAFAYVTNSGSNTVSVIATAGNTVVGTVTVGPNPTGIAITPNGAFAYVANFVSNTVSVIATASNTVVGIPIPVGQRPDFLAVSPDGVSVYVPNQTSNTVSVIATATNTVVDSPITVGTAPTGVAFTSVDIPIIPTLSDGAMLLLLGAMAATLTLRIARRSIVSR